MVDIKERIIKISLLPLNSQVAELVDAAEVSDRFGNKKVIVKTYT